MTVWGKPPYLADGCETCRHWASRPWGGTCRMSEVGRGPSIDCTGAGRVCEDWLKADDEDWIALMRHNSDVR